MERKTSAAQAIHARQTTGSVNTSQRQATICGSSQAAAISMVSQPSASAPTQLEAGPSTAKVHGVQTRNHENQPLTDADKNTINRNYAWLGKDPPYPFENWPMRIESRGKRGG